MTITFQTEKKNPPEHVNINNNMYAIIIPNCADTVNRKRQNVILIFFSSSITHIFFHFLFPTVIFPLTRIDFDVKMTIYDFVM